MTDDQNFEPVELDLPEVPEAAGLDGDDPTSWSTPPVDAGSNGSALIWLAMALLVVVAGAVYVLGSVTRAEEQTAKASEQAERTLKAYDPDEFTNEFEPSDSIPLVDGSGLATEPPPAMIDGDAGEGSDEDVAPVPHPGMAIDPAVVAMAFVNRAPGDDYGRVAYLDFDGTRHQTELECGRIDLNEAGGVCLSIGGGISGTGQGLITNPALVPTKTFGLTTPSRAAVSPDGSVVAWTGFTRGHSYLDPGEFATLTQLISVERRVAADLETNFTTYEGDRIVRNADRNYWGVSFVDNDHFFATVGFEDTTAIVEGHVSNSTLEIVFDNATCPEVSPDGTIVVAKEMRDDRFQLVAIDVASGDRRDLDETRSVDDQVEWVDEDTIVYALPNDEAGTAAEPVFDIWALDIAPGSAPRLLVPFADSPAV